jgi:hypothetical protein
MFTATRTSNIGGKYVSHHNSGPLREEYSTVRERKESNKCLEKKVTLRNFNICTFLIIISGRANIGE